MIRQFEAVFEEGVLRPLEPLALRDKQHVLVAITDIEATRDAPARQEEQEWLRIHGSEYLGQWVALDGRVLLSHGPKARAVRDEARRKGIRRPLVVRIPADLGQPSAGWL
jgi:predicted DNA-binding antitoxin AbrB/MazE fold protein